MSGKKVLFDYSRFKLNRDTTPSSPGHPSSEKNPKHNAKATKQKNSDPNKFEADDIRIVIIDDEPEIVEVLQDILSESGFVVTGFTSPTVAIEQIPLIKPEVVLTDFEMPELTGIEVLKKIIQIDPDLPVIYLSGHLSKDVIMESLNHGIFGALEKPFHFAQVIALCKNAAERYKMAKLLNNTISFIYYQYSDLDHFLQVKGAVNIREQMHSQLKLLIEAKRKLKFLKRSSSSQRE